jgi:hypothetical protein
MTRGVAFLSRVTRARKETGRARHHKDVVVRVALGLVFVAAALVPLDRKPRGIWSTLAYQRRERVAAGHPRRGDIWLPRIGRTALVIVGLLYAAGALT